jgi:O-antigen ligase
LALLVFFLVTTGGLLAFGSVDRAVQIPLVILLGIGLVLQPPRLMQLPGWMNRVMLGLVIILILKELLPAGWFGIPPWRTSIAQDFGVQLPGTHHPEPGRALDGWLAGVIALMWFSWVRALSAGREDRVKAAWILVVSATIVTAASLGLSKISSDSIFGLRYTPEWFGFGPFPNRNHTGSLFAMAVLVGIGCVAHSGAQKRFTLLCAGAIAICVIMAGLLRTNSRGALLALGVGFVFFCVAMVAQARTRKAVSIALAIVLLLGGAALIAGEKTIRRLRATTTQGVPDDSSRARIAIWSATLSMAKAAPALGHGVGSFQSIFPFYQDLQMEDVTVKHPESSWLQWLAELGAVPLLILTVVAGAFLAPHLKYAFERRSSFFLAMGGFGAAAVLLAHSLVDVPGHRWGTVGFALAALAVACPASLEVPIGSRRAALVPLAIAGFWMLPIFTSSPAWSPFQLDRVLSAGAMNPIEHGKEIQAALRWFPLSAKLRLLHGKYLEAAGALPALWQKEYRIAARLVPSSSTICIQIARRTQQVTPSLALHYWQMAIERASLHRPEVFRNAITETKKLKGADETWDSYLDLYPDLLLTYAEERPESAPQAFNRWWELRGSKPEPVSTAEEEKFLTLAEKLATVDQVTAWAQLPNRPVVGMRRLVEFLQEKKAFNKAWEIASREIKEPEYPPALPSDPREALEKRWTENPGDVVNARNYAQVLSTEGEHGKEGEVIERTASSSDAPRWFVDKAAYLNARKQQYPAAVELALRSLEH